MSNSNGKLPHVLEPHVSDQGSLLRQVILGGQDGLVNVLGVLLAVATATQDVPIVIIAGLAATFAESISMAAVAYTSAKAAKEHYLKELEREKREIKEVPEAERDEIRQIYRQKGFKGKDLERVVKVITSNEKIWLNVMMNEELGLKQSGEADPFWEGVVVGVSATVGSVIPLFPFFLFPVTQAMGYAFVVSVLSLFVFGAYKTKFTVGTWWKSGIELAAIGTAAALAGYFIGKILGATVA